MPHDEVRVPPGGLEAKPGRPLEVAPLRERNVPCHHPLVRQALPDGLTAEVSQALGGGASIAEVPAWVQPADGRSIVVERVGDVIELYPVQAGKVIDAAVVAAALDSLEPALATLEWTDRPAGDDDTPWLNAWRHGNRSGIEVVVIAGEPASSLAARIRSALESRDASAVGGGGRVGRK